MDRLLQLEVFSKTAELGSLSKAAEILRMSNAAASRHLSALEERLAVRLIERNTRRQWLTEAGQELLQRCSTLLNELAESQPQSCQLVELKYFLGLTDEEAAEVLGMKLRTVQRMWHDVREWLFDRAQSEKARAAATS